MSAVAGIDLFCGAGGLTHGLVSEGIPIKAGIDIDAACRYPFESNNRGRFIEQDVSQTTPDELQDHFGNAEVRILAGCPPCQPFSTYSQRYDTVGSSRWALLNEFARLAEGVRPEIITMENVPSVEKHTVYGDFVAALNRLGYHVWHEVIDCSSYGLPQRRRRRVLLASRLGAIDLIEPPHAGPPTTVRQTIEGLAPLAAGEASRADPLHAAAKLSELNLKRIRASEPGGTWRDWPGDLRAACHRKQSGKTYSGVYGRMQWDEPAPTLTTQFFGFGSGRFGHPEQDRAVSLREGALLQGFPESYSFAPAGSRIQFTTLGRLIGNAVPVTLGKVIGRSIQHHLQPLSRATNETEAPKPVTGRSHRSGAP